MAFGIGIFLTTVITSRELNKIYDAQLAQAARALIAKTRHEILNQDHQRLDDSLAKDDNRYHSERGGKRDEKHEERHFEKRDHESHDDEDQDHAPLKWKEHRHAFFLKYAQEYEQSQEVQVFDPQGGLIFKSSNELPVTPTPVHEGFSDQTLLGQDWRVFVLKDDESGVVVRAFQPKAQRFQMLLALTVRMGYPLLFVLPFLAFMVLWSVGRSLESIHRLTSDLKKREPTKLDGLDVQSVPEEIQPLVSVLNDLFSRLKSALEKERRFTSEAAHELRTPLAGLKTQAEVALGAQNSQERERALGNIIQAVDRCTHLVTQLLALARIDSRQGAQTFELVSLAKIAGQQLGELVPEALRKNHEISVDADEEIKIRGSEVMLGVLIRNLAENAIRYTPAGGRIRVRIYRDEDVAVLDVIDNGPGISPDQRQRVFERFVRLDGAGDSAMGSGLGLSIVQNIVEMHKGTCEVQSPTTGSGTLIRVRFPN